MIQVRTEAASRGLEQKVFLKILQNSQENTCVRVSFLVTLPSNVTDFTDQTEWEECLQHKTSCVFFKQISR